MNALDRSVLPEWPRLMSEDLAAAYLSIGKTMLREQGPEPQRIGHRVVWDRKALDRWADVLSGQPLTAEEAEAEQSEVERRFLDKLETMRL